MNDARDEAAAWNKAFTSLGLSVRVVPGECCGLPADWGDVVLLPNFGAPNGMVLISRGADVLAHSAAMQAKGYGYSVVEPNPDSSAPDSRESTIDMLRDWGWTGAEAARPSWY